MRFVYAAAFMAALLSAAGCGRMWPSASGLADPTFLKAGGVRSVAIVVPDVTVGVCEDVDEAPEAVAASFEGAARIGMEEELEKRGYRIQGGDAAGAEPDAVLSLAGFAYAGHDGPSGGEVALGVLAVVLVVGIIVLAVAGARHGRGGHGGGGHGGGGGAHGAGGHGPALGHVGGGHGSHGGGFHGRGFHRGPDVEISLVLPPGPVVNEVPSEGPSHSLLSLRLVDRRTGRMLWQSQADFPANPGRPEDVRQAVERLASSLPRAR